MDQQTISQPGSAAAAAAAAAAALATAAVTATATATATAATAIVPVTELQASRFLAQASTGATRDQIAQVRTLGFAGWIDAQFALPQSPSRWDWLIAKGYNGAQYKNSETGFDPCAWRKLITAPDTLRQRVTLALSEIMVVAIDGLVGAGWRAFSAAAYLDLLETNAFGNYRTLLGQVSTSAPMGQFLTFRGSTKYNPNTGAMPDENYARELMQLFTIGLVQLNQDGTPKLSGGAAQETYGLADITGLARIFTGWDFDLAGADTSTPAFLRRPLIQYPKRHETGSSTFLGATVAGGLSGADALQRALDVIFSHANLAPFVSRQLIQRLVTSNPRAAYVGRVAAVFNNDGRNVRGNLQAVIKAILLDADARQPAAGDTGYGKLREPMLRLTGWARACNAASATDAWNIGNTSDPAKALGQSPLRSPSVFNFFRPGYVPANSGIAAAALVAPEFQLANESSVVGYVNFMQRAVGSGLGEVKGNYDSLVLLAAGTSTQPLLDELNLVLAAGQLSAATLALMRGALDAMPRTTPANRLNRVYAAVTMALAAPEFLIQK